MSKYGSQMTGYNDGETGTHIEGSSNRSALLPEQIHVDNTGFYESRQTLHRIRVILFFFSATFATKSLYSSEGFSHWFLNFFKFFTNWGQTMVLLYLMWVIWYFPKTKVLNARTIVFQQAVLTCQTVIVLIYWTILAPHQGWSKSFTFDSVFPHSFPYLCMIHEMVATYGDYSKKGDVAGLVILGLYLTENICLAFFDNIIVYDTPLTNPKKWISFPVFFVTIFIVLGISRLYKKIKYRITRNFILRTKGGVREDEADTPDQQVVQHTDEAHVTNHIRS